jgi:sugar/nucleoside kinase (ribokinase family)
VVLDTMNFWMDCALPELLDVIKRVDVITINDEEARQLSGEYSLVKAAAKIHTMGPKYVVIKKGEHGALIFHKSIFSLHQHCLWKMFLIQQVQVILLQVDLQDSLHSKEIFHLKL